MEVLIKPLSKEMIDDFLYFFDEVAFTDNKEWDGCYCYFYHFDKDDSEWINQTREKNRLSAVKLIQEGKMTGYLAYKDGKPIGWCNANDRTNYPRLASSQELWDGTGGKMVSIVCFIIAPQFRRKGIASKILDTICSDYSKKGYETIEAYPRKGELTSAEHYHGPLSMYLKKGFTIYKQFHGYDIVRKKL